MIVPIVIGLVVISIIAAASPPLGVGAAFFAALGLWAGYVLGWNGAIDAVHTEDVGRADDAKARRVKRW